jgi:hypothetical protein
MAVRCDISTPCDISTYDMGRMVEVGDTGKAHTFLCVAAT